MKQSNYRLLPAMQAASCAVLLLFIPVGAQAAAHPLLSKHVPKTVASGQLQPTGFLPDTNILHLAIGLPSRDQAGLDKFLKQLYDPTSPIYHHYLTVEQFAERFGPTKADYEALRAFAKANGLNETKTYGNRLVLSVDAPVAAIRKALHVNIRTYQHPTENRTFYAPDVEPTLDLKVSVLHVAGLDNYELPKPRNMLKPVKAGANPQPRGGGTNNNPRFGTGPEGSYLSADLRNAYAPGVTLSGSGQSIGLFEYAGFFENDVIAYEQLSGLPNINVVVVPIDGGVGSPNPFDDGVGECSLDIDMCMAMAPGITTIYVYESPGGPADDEFSAMAMNTSTLQFSSSWGFTGDSETDVLYQEMGAQGQTVFFASGDRGGFDGPDLPDGSGPQSSQSPYFVDVGGTELVMNGFGASYNSESVWGTGQYVPGANWGSTGGIGTYYSIPIWQIGVNMSANGGSTSNRNCPDVALTADNVWIIAGDGLQTGASGGTSAASPLWAGYNALINQQAATYSLPPDGFICPAVYAIGQGPNYSLCFHDITVGNNIWPGSPSNYYAVPGYDLCTGWGTPTGSNLIDVLAPPQLYPVLSVVTNVISGGNGNGVIDYDECNDLTFVVTNEGIVNATGLVGILSSSTPGVIVAQATANFPNLPAKTGGQSLTPFTISTEPDFICGTPVELQLILKCDQDIQTNVIEIPSGSIGAPVQFNSARSVAVPSLSLNGVNSPITVSGLQSAEKLTVSLYLVSPNDGGITLRLKGPDGQVIILTEDAGFGSANFGESCSSTNNETTFDDDSTNQLFFESAPFIGTFQPLTPLGSFLPAYGSNLNGIWQMNVINTLSNNPSTLECWTLHVVPYTCADGGGQCVGAALSMTMSAAPNPVLVYSNLVYTMVVSNAGPSTASNVVISQTLPPGVGYVTTTNSNVVGVTQVGTTLDINIGSLDVYQATAISIVTIPIFPGSVTSEATVTSSQSNPNPNGATASATTLVTLPTAQLAVSMSAVPAAILQGGDVTFNMFVTNNGPFGATNVFLTNTLPANVNLISASAAYTVNHGALVFSLGTLAQGASAAVSIVVSPTTTGNITDTAQVGLSPLETDPVTFDTTASVTVTVGPSADLQVSSAISPVTLISGGRFTNVSTIFNIGPSPANNVVFTETIPATSPYAATWVSSKPTNVTVTNNVITWDVGSLASGASTNITNILLAPTLASNVTSVPFSTTFSVFGQPGDPDTNNNVVTITDVVEPPTVTVSPAGVSLVSQSLQPPNGAVNPGETVGVIFYLKDTGNIATTNLVATLQDTGGVTLASAAQTYGALTPGASAVGEPFTFTASGTNGGTVVATLALQDGTANLGTVSYTFYMPVIQTFWNTNVIYIPATNFTPDPDEGPASPYPSLIQVSNVSGYVSKVDVTVSNLSHTYPHDIGMLLVGPGADTNCVLMGQDASNFSGLVGATVTFDSTAAAALPIQGAFSSGIYAPVSYNPSNFFSNTMAPPYATNLDVFNGLPADGAWSLYVLDNAPGDAGGISNGWGLTITTVIPVNPTNTLSVGIAASTNTVPLGSPVTYLFSVTNLGPLAVNGFLTNTIPAGLAFTSASVAASNLTQVGQTVILNLGSLAPGAILTITNVDTASALGLQTNNLTSGQSTVTFNTTNNTADAVTSVVMPSAVIAAGFSVAPNPVIIGSNFTYTLYATNLGPGNALGITGAFSLTNLTLVSVAPSQGTYGATNGVLYCNVGTIAPSNIATVVVTATAPLTAGVLSNAWSISTTSTDTNTASDSVTAIVTVEYLEPQIVPGGATLLTQGGATPPNGAINAGETVTVAFTLDNVGNAPTTNLTATLQGAGGVTPITTSQVYGPVAAGASAAQSYTFSASGAPGATVTATLALVDGSYSLGNAAFTFQIPVTTNYSNTNAIIIPEQGAATPYPSQILVSGLTNATTNLLVDKVTVTLNGFAHTYPHDVNVLLEDPAGQELIVMGHAGGPYAVTNLTLTFADAATVSLPVGQLTNGTYLPTDYAPVDIFPGLAPASTADVLALFNGTNPNGYWSLYVYDDTAGNGGVITGGWSLGLTALDPINPASLLAVSMASSPNPVSTGNFLNYLVTITNLGPDLASNVVLTQTLPANVTFVSATPSQGGFTQSGNQVICNFGSISNGALATLGIKVLATVAGPAVSTASSTTSSTDLYPAEGSAVNTTTVVAAPMPTLAATNLSGILQLTLQGQTSRSYVIQVSSNLTTWSNIDTNTTSPTTGTFIYTNSITNAPARYFRAFIQPQ